MRKLLLIISIALFCNVAFGQSTPGTVRFPTNLDDSDSLFRTTDNARSTLTNSITSGSTAIDVTSTSTFPATGSIVIDNEIIYYTSKTSTQFSGLMRGAVGTTAASHTAGVSVRSPILAVHHNKIVDSIVATQTKIGSGSSTPTSGTILSGSGTGTSAWSSTPSLTRLTLNGATTTAAPGTTPVAATRQVFYDATSGGAGFEYEYMAVGVESSALWFNNITSGSYNFYFGGTKKYELNATDFRPTTNDNVDIGTSSKAFKNLYLSGTAKAKQWNVDGTITAGGTTGAQTINKGLFTVNFAAAATSLVVTNSLVTTSSVVQCTVRTNDSTLKSVQAVSGSGSVTLYANAAATAETSVGCEVKQPS